jgi:hypothetical protein
LAVDVDLDLLLWILIAEQPGVDQTRVPLLPSLVHSELGLVHWLVLTWGELLPDDEEEVSTILKVSIKVDLSILAAR